MHRLLVVEDDASLRKLYEAEFSEAGYVVTCAASGNEALERIRSVPPEVIVLDIRLGDMNGLDVMRGLLQSHPEIGVVLNSAYPGYKQNFASWSADSYVVKSSDLTELKSAVAAAVTRRRQVA